MSTVVLPSAGGAVWAPGGVGQWPPAWTERAVPATLPGATHCGPLVETAAGEVLLRIPPAGRFLVVPDEPVRVQRAPGATDADVRCFLHGPVGAAVLVQRGVLAVRAATVSVAGTGVLICGGAASGKSTLAAALAGNGHPVLGDGVGAVRADRHGATVEPLGGEVHLWPDMVRVLGLDPAHGRTVRPALAKAAFRLGPRPSPVPVGAVVMLWRGHRERVEHRTAVWDRFSRLSSVDWHRVLAGHLGRSETRFGGLTAVAGVRRFVSIELDHTRLTAPARLARLVEEALA